MSSSSAIEILVEPLQSSFFAGEPLTVHITFTNTLRLPATGPSRLSSSSRGHRSSLSLAGPPPTVPLPRSRTPTGPEVKTAVASIFDLSSTPKPSLPVRRGLIGKPPSSPSSSPPRASSSSDAGLYGSRRLPRQGHRKNVYSIAPGAVEDMSSVLAAERQNVDLGRQRVTSSNGAQLSGKGELFSGCDSARLTSLTRYRTVPPSIREEGTGSDETDKQYAVYSSSIPASPSSRRSSLLSQSSTLSFHDHDFDISTPRTSVDFYNLGRGSNDSMDSVVRDQFTDFARRPSRRSSIISSSGQDFPYSVDNSFLPLSKLDAATQTLLWTFAHFEGQFEVDEGLIKPGEFVAVKQALFGERGGMVGGGSMAANEKSRGWLWDSGGSLEERRNRALGDRSTPILKSRPSILGVDIRLKPGEKKTCEFSF
jgi:hypothetical protein